MCFTWQQSTYQVRYSSLHNRQQYYRLYCCRTIIYNNIYLISYIVVLFERMWTVKSLSHRVHTLAGGTRAKDWVYCVRGVTLRSMLPAVGQHRQAARTSLHNQYESFSSQCTGCTSVVLPMLCVTCLLYIPSYARCTVINFVVCTTSPSGNVRTVWALIRKLERSLHFRAVVDRSRCLYSLQYQSSSAFSPRVSLYVIVA